MVVGLRKMHQRRGAGGGVRACGARARAAERGERAESSGAERRGRGAARAAERDSIADGTALRNIVGEEVAATFESSRRNHQAILFLCRLRYSSVFLSKNCLNEMKTTSRE